MELMQCTLMLLCTILSVQSFFISVKPRTIPFSQRVQMSNDEQQPQVTTSNIRLKVPAAAWRWPNAWPFAEDVFKPAPVKTERLPYAEDHKIQYFHEKIWNYFLSEHPLEHKLLVIDENFRHEKIISNGNVMVQSKLQSTYDYEEEFFDSILVLSGFDSAQNPRDIFRELWRILKPNSSCNIAFQAGTNQTSEESPIKLWTTTNDEQKIWVAGSYLNYAVKGGWAEIEAYDVSGATGNETMRFQTTSDDEVPVFLIRGRKLGIEPLTANSSPEEIANYVDRKLASAPDVDEVERKVLSFRLATEFVKEKVDLVNLNLHPIVTKLESIFLILKEVKDNVIPKPAKALLAYLLLKEWNFQPIQVDALKMAIGQLPPSEDFWIPVGRATANLAPTEKLFFLADIIGQFGRSDFDVTKFNRFPSLLTEIIEILKPKLSDLKPNQIEKLATDFIISEYWLVKDKPNAEQRLIKYLQGVNKDALLQLLETR